MPFCPGPTRTSSVAPGGTELLPLRSTTLTWRKASPPLGSCTKPKPFSGLYHFTVAETGGLVGVVSQRGLLSRGIPEIRRRRVAVIIEASPLLSPENSIFTHAPDGFAGQLGYCRARVL